jgi:hypothetical protein
MGAGLLARAFWIADLACVEPSAQPGIRVYGRKTVLQEAAMRRLAWIGAVLGLVAFSPALAEDDEEQPGCAQICLENAKKCVAGCDFSDDKDDCVEACREASEACIDECD